jgi:hypothetical protein
MSQAPSIGFRPKCHLEYVHDATGCVPLRCSLCLITLFRSRVAVQAIGLRCELGQSV